MKPKAIPGFPGYFATRDGRIWSDWTGVPGKLRELKAAPNKAGYRIVKIGLSSRYVHKLVMLAFRGPPKDPAHEIRHLNDDKSDNALSNLRYGTHKQNIKDSKRNGTWPW